MFLGESGIRLYERYYLKKMSHKEIMELIHEANVQGLKIIYGYDKKKGGYLVIGDCNG